MTVHYHSRKLTITRKNAARHESQKDAILTIEGCATNAGGRGAYLVRNNEPVNVHTLILGELRLPTGIGRNDPPSWALRRSHRRSLIIPNTAVIRALP